MTEKPHFVNKTAPASRPFLKAYHHHLNMIPDIGTAAFALLAVLSNHRDRHNLAWPSQARLCHLTGMSQPSLIKYTGKLVDAKLIELGKATAPTGHVITTYTLSKITGRYAKLHTDILGLLPEIGHVALALYAWFARYARHDDLLAWPTQEQMAKAAGISERSLHRHIQALFDYGLVEGHKQEWQGTNRWVYKVIGLKQSPRKNGQPLPAKFLQGRPDNFLQPPPAKFLHYLDQEGFDQRSKSLSLSGSCSFGSCSLRFGSHPPDSANRDRQPNSPLIGNPLDPPEKPEPPSARSTPSGPLAWEKDPEHEDWETKTLVYRHHPTVAAKTGKLNDSGELNVRTEMIPWDESDVASGYPSRLIPSVTNPVMFHHSTVSDHLCTVSEAGDNSQPLCQPEIDREQPVDQEPTAEAQHDLRPDPTLVEMEAFWADLSSEAQATIKAVITRHVAARDGDVVAQWLTRPAMLAEMANLGIQQVLRMASDVTADEPVIASAFADTPDDIRFRVRQRQREQQAAWARFDQDQRESAARVTGIDHTALSSELGAAALVDYQLPGGGSLAVPITNNGFGWAVPLTASEVEALPWPSVDKPVPILFSPVDDVVTSVLDDLAPDWPGQVDEELKCVVDNGTTELSGLYPDDPELNADLDCQLVTQMVMLATATNCKRARALAVPTVMAMAEDAQSGIRAVRGPPTRRRWQHHSSLHASILAAS